MAVTGRIVLVVSAVMFSGACYEGAGGGTADVVTTRSAGFNAQVLNGPILQGPILQGPILQGLILQGPILQGPILQGPILQGPILQGPILQGITLNGPILQGPILQGPILQGTEFSAYVLKDGVQVPVEGEDFVGSEWDIRVGQVDGEGNELIEDYVLRIDAIELSQEQDDVYLYDIVHRPKSGGAWKPLCGDEGGNMVPAIPLQNYWNLENGDRVDDPNVITFACTNAVLAKCVLWGYRPWASATRCEPWDKDKNCEEVSLTDYHQACTRMARADYCGDGVPWTVAGTAIDLWDHLSPQIESPTTDWTIEAEWNPDGAFCLDDIRLQSLKAEGKYPACFLDKKGKPEKIGNCGSLKKHRALITSTFDKPKKSKKNK